MGNADDKSVLVTDRDWNFLEPTRPGKARRLMDQGEAVMVSRQPPMIQMKNRKDQGGSKMSGKENQSGGNLGSLSQFFKENDDIYIQNIYGGKISLQFSDESGEILSHKIPYDQRPYCLSDYIPKEYLLKSAGFRSLLMRQPQVLRLLTQEEYQTMVNRVAETVGGTAQEVANDIAAKVAGGRVAPAPINVSLDSADGAPKDNTPVFGDTDVPGVPGEADLNPRMLQLMAESDPAAERRRDPKDVLTQLSAMTLTNDELNFVLNNPYQLVRGWAKKQLLAKGVPVQSEEKIEIPVDSEAAALEKALAKDQQEPKL